MGPKYSKIISMSLTSRKCGGLCLQSLWVCKTVANKCMYYHPDCACTGDNKHKLFKGKFCLGITNKSLPWKRLSTGVGCCDFK